jgi:glycerate 2-kinase
LFGGETTVKVTGDGIGGRNQHLALHTAMAIRDIPGITFLSAGTDGNDGNSDAAGAVVDSETAHLALSMNADPSLFLQNFDSYSFFRSVGGHVYTGPTMTNVMDIAIAIIN